MSPVFCTTSLKSNVYFTLSSTSQFRLATFQELNSYIGITPHNTNLENTELSSPE